MPDTTDDIHAGSHEPRETTTATTTSGVSRTPVEVSRSTPRWLAPLALLLSAVAVALAVWSLVKSSQDSDAALPGDPKMRICSAFETVARGVALQTHNDLGPDQVAQAAVAGNARLALLGGGQYLVDQVDSKTPKELAEAVTSFGRDLQDIGASALSGVQNSDPAQAARLAEGDSARKRVVELCK